MHGEVLGTGQQFFIGMRGQGRWIGDLLAIVGIALQATYHGQSHLRRKERVLTIGLLTTAPAWVTEDVDVRGPERQTLIATDVA